MRQIVTQAIVLSRTNFQEADRILSLLTSDHGKLSVIARGVRKERSKLAGGVELFSINEIGFLKGRGEVATLTTSRLKKHFGNIVKDIDRTTAGYEFLKIMQKVTEDNAEREYFDLLEEGLRALDDANIDLDLLKLWFDIRLLQITGHNPNLESDTNNQKLSSENIYHFDLEKMSFTAHPEGMYAPGHIMLLRLARSNSVGKLHTVQGIGQFISLSQQLALTMRKYILKI